MVAHDGDQTARDEHTFQPTSSSRRQPASETVSLSTEQLLLLTEYCDSHEGLSPAVAAQRATLRALVLMRARLEAVECTIVTHQARALNINTRLELATTELARLQMEARSNTGSDAQPTWYEAFEDTPTWHEPLEDLDTPTPATSDRAMEVQPPTMIPEELAPPSTARTPPSPVRAPPSTMNVIAGAQRSAVGKELTSTAMTEAVSYTHLTLPTIRCV